MPSDNNLPEVLQPAIPDDTSLAEACPVWLDFTELEAAFKDVDGKRLAQAGEFGQEVITELAGMDTQVKAFIPAYESWHEASDMGALERWGERAKRRRLEITNRAEAIRRQFKNIASDFSIEHDRIVEAERRRLEEAQRLAALAEKQREIEAAQAAEAAAQTPEEKAEIADYIQQLDDTPFVPVAVSTQQVEAAGGVAAKPKGTTSTPVCWRRVTDLQKLFAYLGSEAGKNLIGSLCRVRGGDRQSDEITISFTPLKKALDAALPGVTNTRGAESSNRGRA